MEKIANQLLEEVGDGELTKIPPDDLDPEVVSVSEALPVCMCG